MVTSFFVKAIIVIVFMISGNYAQNDGICSMDNYNKTYVCQFNENCWSSNRNQHISCLDDKDCQIECNGRRSCAKSTITCPEYGNCHIICSASHSCALSTIKCPKYGNCHIVCSESNACFDTDIVWSNQPVRSTLTCNATESKDQGCDSTTQPPLNYPYMFVLWNIGR
eukprot:177906_1